jgi:hypothetical protein
MIYIQTEGREMAASTVKIGTKFRSHYADGNPEWTVTKKAGKGVWLAVALNDPDWAGSEKAFKKSEIEQALNMSNAISKMGSDHDQFYSNLKPGQIIHYHSSFGKFVRCEVTEDHKLLPLSLVGAWDSYDLPRRNIDGSIYNPPYANDILCQKTMTPNFTNLWEASDRLQKQHNNPIKLKPLNLSVPDMTPEQKETAKWEQLRNKINEAVSTRDNPDGKAAVVAVLELLQASSLV